MKYGVISDIHGNLVALEAVLEELKSFEVDRFICPGDVVGYGPNPAECITRVRNLDAVVVLGNHDAAVCAEMDIGWFNPFAREAIIWTRDQLSENDIKWLKMLPLTYDFDQYIVVHSSLAEPQAFHYIQSTSDAKICFEHMDSLRACIIGHSHVAEVYVREEGKSAIQRIAMQDGGELRLECDYRYILNCGSVGQPRDGNPYAACALFDTDTMVFQIRRVPYDIREVQLRMRKVGLPDILIERLEYGV